MTRREFSAPVKKAARKRANGYCEGCGQPLGPHNPPEVDHDKEDWEGGEPTLENAKVLGRKCCHRFKTKAATTRRAKADRAAKKHQGIKPKGKKLKSRNTFHASPSNVKRIDLL